MSLKNNIIRIFSANFLTLISSIIMGFIIPSIISVNAYSNIKTYTFYLSYLGILHLGFVDGMYIKYGGKDISELDKSELKMEHRVFTIIQAIMTLVIIFISVITKNLLTFILALSIIPVNTLQFHQLFYQAIGEFKQYSKSMYIYTVINLLLNIILAIIFANQNYYFYCLATLISNVIAYMILEIKFYKDNIDIKAKYNKKIWNNIKIGFFILIGNLSVIIFLGIDRWFIKLFFDSDTFAYYSFAVSMLSIVNVLVSAISITFYNYLSKGENEEEIKKLKKCFLILGSFASGIYFALAAIVSIFLKKYAQSLNIIAISFAAYPYMIVINALYVNLYKARKDQNKYVKIVFLMVIISIIYNVVALSIFKTAESIALATTLAFITWYLYSIKDFKYLKCNLKEIVYLLIILGSFLFLANSFNWFIGGMLYIMIILITNIIIYKKEILDILKIIMKK